MVKFGDEELKAIIIRSWELEHAERLARGLSTSGPEYRPGDEAGMLRDLNQDQAARSAADRQLKREIGPERYRAFADWRARSRRRKNSRFAGRRYPTNMAEVYDLMRWGPPPELYKRPLDAREARDDLDPVRVEEVAATDRRADDHR